MGGGLGICLDSLGKGMTMFSCWVADERLNDIVGSAYYVAPEVLHRSYSMEADVWSIGVITYILVCGSRPFWARTESGIFRAVLRADPSFEEAPWPSVSPEAKDFVKRLLNKDMRKRMTAAQALSMYILFNLQLARRFFIWYRKMCGLVLWPKVLHRFHLLTETLHLKCLVYSSV